MWSNRWWEFQEQQIYVLSKYVGRKSWKSTFSQQLCQVFAWGNWLQIPCFYELDMKFYFYDWILDLMYLWVSYILLIKCYMILLKQRNTTEGRYWQAWKTQRYCHSMPSSHGKHIRMQLGMNLTLFEQWELPPMTSEIF